MGEAELRSHRLEIAHDRDGAALRVESEVVQDAVTCSLEIAVFQAGPERHHLPGQHGHEASGRTRIAVEGFQQDHLRKHTHHRGRRRRGVTVIDVREQGCLREQVPVMGSEENDFAPSGVDPGQTDFSALHNKQGFRLVPTAEEGFFGRQHEPACRSARFGRYPSGSVHGVHRRLVRCIGYPSALPAPTGANPQVKGNGMPILTVVIAAVSLLYATVGQAGGTALVAVMGFAGFPSSEMRPTALLLNIVAASYATWRLHQKDLIDWSFFARIAATSLPAAFLGGLVVLDGKAYFLVTGSLLVIAAALMLLKHGVDNGADRQPPAWRIGIGGAGAGFLSGVSGIGGGVFLAPLLIALTWTAPKRAAYLSAPFILFNSLLGFGGVWISGQAPAPGTALYSVGALVGSVIGSAIGLRWMSDWGARHMLAAILLFAGLRLLFR